MTLIDTRGRLFGRFNLVDATVAAFILLLIPLAYGTSLLFRPAQPRMDSVTPSLITKEERRVSTGGRLMAKFKVRGTGFTPLLRARVGDVDAIGFVFENPNSADVLVGPVPPGAHDLVLLDGVQEVARARQAITIQPDEASFIRAVGWLSELDAQLLNWLQVGTSYPEATPTFQVIALGPAQPARTRVRLGGAHAEIPLNGLQEREAVLTLRCDAARDDNPCAIGDRPENLVSPVVLSLPGPVRYFHFALQELLPPAPPRTAEVRLRMTDRVAAALVREGDRDAFLDQRAAVITRVTREAGAAILMLKLGADDTRGGWRYRDQLLKPGATLHLITDGFVGSGTIESITMAPANGSVMP